MENNKSGTNQKLWIFGDSFTGMQYKDESWMWLLYKSFVGNRIYVSSKGSRDVQTIIDIFLRNLKDIKTDDFVILMLPTLSRFRLPIKNPTIDCEFHSEFKLGHEKMYHLDYFTGNGYYTCTAEQFDENILEEPISFIHYKEFDLTAPDKKPSTGSIISMINSSNANLTNTNEILKSFVKYFPFKLAIYSWVNELDDSIVMTKSKIESDIGFWHTLRDVWNETNGEEGRMSDIHWSKKMDKAFFEYVAKSYPEYFKN